MPRHPTRHHTRHERRLPWRHLLLVAAIVLTYANGLSAPFVLDDQATVVLNPGIRGSWLTALVNPAPDSPVAGRPLASLTFAINYAAGGLDVRGYRALNIALHAACALLAFSFLRQTLNLPRIRDRLPAPPADLALAAALLWAVHPLNSEVVNYVSQRTESLMAACYLATMIGAVRSATATRAALWTAMATTAAVLGALCKESIATVPLVVALYDRAFLFDSWRGAWGRRWTLYLGLATSWLVLAAVLVLDPRGAVAGFSSGIPPWTYLMNQAVVIAEYLRLAFWPVSLVAFYGWPEPLSLGDVWPQAGFLGLLVILTAAAAVRGSAIGFAGAWFFVTLAPASSVVPVATEVGAERRMYLPLVALIALVVVIAQWAVSALVRRTSAHPATRASAARPVRVRAVFPAGLLLCAAAAAALASATIARNREYGSALTLARTIVDRRPTPVAHHMLGEQLSQAGRLEEAAHHLREAVAARNTRAEYLLGIVELNRGNIEAGVQHLDRFVKTAGVRQVPRWLEPPLDDVLRARVALGAGHLQRGEWLRAEEQARAALAAAPRYVEAHAVLARALFGQQRWQDAAAEYAIYLAARPDDVAAVLDFGVALVASGRLSDALPVFRRAVGLDPASERARRLLALAEEDAARGVR